MHGTPTMLMYFIPLLGQVGSRLLQGFRVDGLLPVVLAIISYPG